ncbi:hypothetical protein ARMSODRAFT_954724 [Armillaria solidipes]|uniref:Uncharacterized protein n=1 Tax=Armillaria solidipes TaxID=1076256 RepID=A0A2H3BM02_9AGAR|nr:hypothetical protein ARMSODRAFT_954724 [Armillaria solidipes]
MTPKNLLTPKVDTTGKETLLPAKGIRVDDACCGPYLDDDTAALTIDTRTRLYNQWNMLPSASLITKRPGVTCIDGQYQTSPQSPSANEVANAVLSALGLPAEANSPITYVKWAHLREWINEVLDDSWCVKCGRVGVGEATAHALWYLKHKANSDSLKITVYVESPTDADGVLDMAASRQAARQCLANFITSTDAPIQLIWTRGELNEFGEYSVRYADGGRCIIVAAGQTVVEILNNGNSLTAETFKGCARKLLEHTIRRDGPPLTAPIIKRGPFLSMTAGNHDEHPSKLLVHSVDGRFSLYFELDKPVATANATTEGCAYLFDKYIQEVTADSVTVELKMLARSVMGSHVVKAHFADSDTMISRSQTVEIEVVE